MKRIALITTLLAVLSLNTQARSHENNTPFGTWNASTEQITLNVEQDGTYSLYFQGMHRFGKWRWATNGKYMVLIDNSISSELDFMSSHLYQVMVLKPCGKDKLFWSHSVKIVYRPLPKYKKGRKIYLYKVKPED